MDKLGAATMHIPPQQSMGVLEPLKLGSSIKGFFKPLTGVAPSASNIKAAVTPMVGCHITLQGVGVQWISKEVRTVDPGHITHACFPMQCRMAKGVSKSPCK